VSSVIRDLIEYEGIDNIDISKNNNAFKQISIDEISLVPSYKPDMIQITRVSIETNIIDSYLIKTPVGKSVEGVRLTGYKLFISGNIKVKIQYLTDQKCQLINNFFYETAYSGGVVLPSGTREKSYIAPSILVEDIYIKENGPRSIYSSISLVLTGSVC
jgi:hypothetical protein